MWCGLCRLGCLPTEVSLIFVKEGKLEGEGRGLDELTEDEPDYCAAVADGEMGA